MAPPGSLGPLPVALRFVRGRRPRRAWQRLPVRGDPQVIDYLEGDPHQVGSLLAIFGTARVRFDALQQRPGLVGTARDFVETSEQCETLTQRALHWRRDATFGCRLGYPV